MCGVSSCLSASPYTGWGESHRSFPYCFNAFKETHPEEPWEHIGGELTLDVACCVCRQARDKQDGLFGIGKAHGVTICTSLF